MKILAIDFSTSIRSVALVECAAGTSVILGQCKECGTKETNAFQLIQTVLDQAGEKRSEIDALALGLGPGSYGGIRVSLSIAQGWQLASGIQTTGIETVRVLAETARRQGHRGRIDVIVDAQRNEFYHAGFESDDNVTTLVHTLKIITRAELETLAANNSTLIGPDVTNRFAGVTEFHPDAAVLAQLAFTRNEFVSADQLTPVYIRPVEFVKAPAPRTDL